MRKQLKIAELAMKFRVRDMGSEREREREDIEMRNLMTKFQVREMREGEREREMPFSKVPQLPHL